MKSLIRKTELLLIVFSVLIINSCKKEEVPVLTTAAITNILGTSATSGGTITSEGSETVLSRGVCWSTLATPTMADSKTQDGAGAGSFTSSLTELNGATVYYVRAYATNSVGTGYGMAISFTTLGQVPAPTNSAATNITATSATINGTVNPNYLSTIVSFEYGTTTSYGSPVTVTQSPVTGNANTDVSADITALTPGTTYHYRVKAVNSLGTTYSDDITFTTLGQVPTVTTLTATNTNISSATLNGSVNANYLSTDVTFEYGTTTNYGSTASATQSPVKGNTITSVSADITLLTPGTTYHYRLKAVNSLGTSYGSDISFTTLGQVPTVSTLAATNVNVTSVTMNGTVNANYLFTIVIFEYGTTTGYGITLTANQSPVTGNTITNINANITGLTPGTTYHFRERAVNALGTSYGNDMVFETTINGVKGTVSDIDGNIYQTIGIGYQMWMAENLKTTKYKDGTEIPIVTGTIPETGAYCYYENDISNKAIYGALYNWYAVNTGKLCPTGWHAPSMEEWQTLADYLGGVYLAGGKMKEAGYNHWLAPNTGATNESGFTAFPAGQGVITFAYKGEFANFWSSREYETNNSWSYYSNLSYNSSVGGLGGATGKVNGFSVRCLKDN